MKKNAAHELLMDLSAQVAAVLTESGIPEQVASDAGNAVMRRIADYWGGQMLYMPQLISLKAQERNAELYKKFDGRNVNALALEYGISVQQVYKIIRVARASMSGDGPLAKLKSQSARGESE